MRKPVHNLASMERPVRHEDARRLSPRAWVDRLVQGGDGLRYPAFPPEDVQTNFVGSAFADAMGEALRFYEFIHHHADRSWRPSSLPISVRFRRAAGGYLDFGCGWGRFSRLFLRDFGGDQIVGVDIDPDIIEFCQGAGLPGRYLTIGSPPLPFESSTFKLITAYSVFTHLPPTLFEAWLRELGRVLAPGGLLALTVEPPRFLAFVEGLPDKPQGAWYAALARHGPDIARHRIELERRGIAFLPTGGGGVRTTDVYGDAVVTRSYVEGLATTFGTLINYVDDPRRFWQAAAIIQKRG